MLMTSRQRRASGNETRPAPPSDIDNDIIRLDIRCNNLEIWVQRSTRIGLHERVIAWQTREEVSRRLAPAQASALGEHGIDPSSIPVGRVVVMGRHHGIFLKATL